MMPSRSHPGLSLIAVAVILVGILAFFLARSRRGSTPPSDLPTAEQSTPALARNTIAAAGSAAARIRATLTSERRLADAAERARLARQIDEARQAREARLPLAHPSTAERRQEDGLDKEYLRGQMTEIMPLVKECYENALDNNPKLAGRLVVHFNIVAEPQIGGLVESAEVEREGPLGQEPALVECVQESMYALKLKAPRGGGQVKVSYPLIFRPDGPPDDGAPP